MRVLLDQSTPAPLRKVLSKHEIRTAYECGWDTLENGALLVAAENAGFEVLVTADQNLVYQQDLAQRRIAVVVLSSTNWPRIRLHAEFVANALDGLAPGAYVEVTIP